VSDDVRRALRLLALPTIALGVVAAFVPGRVDPAVRVYALLACVVILWLALGAIARAFPPAGPLRPARPGRARPSESTRSLAGLERAVALGTADVVDLQYRLRPRLRELATGLLESRHGIVLDDEPEAARALLGDEAWELLRPDRPTPKERARGPSPAALERVVVSLERL
jgi:hypothetical protein